MRRALRLSRFLYWRALTSTRARIARVELSIEAPLRGAPANPPRISFGPTAKSLDLKLGRRIHFGARVVVRVLGDAELQIGDATSIANDSHVTVGDAKVQIGARTEVRSFVIIRCKAAELIIGDNVMISNFCVIGCGSRTTIGNGSVLAERVTTADGDHTFDSVSTYNAPMNLAPISIGANVLVSANSTITRGVTLGPGAIVGANSVVTRAAPPGAVLLAGTPATVRRELDS